MGCQHSTYFCPMMQLLLGQQVALSCSIPKLCPISCATVNAVDMALLLYKFNPHELGTWHIVLNGAQPTKLPEKAVPLKRKKKNHVML